MVLSVGHAAFDVAGLGIQFEKNLCMAGGFLAFVAAGGGAFSLDRALLGGRTSPAVS